jgi:hypothetical protein
MPGLHYRLLFRRLTLAEAPSGSAACECGLSPARLAVRAAWTINRFQAQTSNAI